jgi:prepilin-type processing-associated H-X9-DG protein
MPTYPLTEIEKKAWDFAEKAHYGVFRKFRNATYFDGHVRKVFGLVKQYDTTPEVGAAALLHDCVEDVDGITYEIILAEFGKEIADLVKELTSCEEYIDVMGKPDYLLDKMVTMSDKALIIKLCDRWQNVSDSFSQQESFRDKYYKETRYIMNGLKSNRQLNQVHKRIIEQIEGILGNLKSRYKYESKHVLMFEDFKQKNVTIEDIIKCIEGGGVIYATTINDFPDNDPEIPLNPLSIDDEGTITVELDGSNHEVELKNVDKIEWKNINERMYFSDGMQSVLIYLSNQKKLYWRR